MNWETILKNNVCSIEQLKQLAGFAPKDEKQLAKIVKRHPMSVTPYYLSLIDWNDPEDPIRRLAVPTLDELNPDGTYDTSGERSNTKMPGLQHKYAQTALVLATNQCAMYCRHCFRKRLVGLSNREIMGRFGEAVKYIQKHTEINNVLISGGDPLVLPTPVIEKFLEKLSPIEHLRFIRIGSRVPVTFPQRILQDKTLPALFKKYSRPDRRLHLVTHFNHPREITRESTRAVAKLLSAGAVLTNQTVLLRGVNDDPNVLADLQAGLVGIGVNPYYVFQCRPVSRVKHCFQLSFKEGLRIVEAARKQLSGQGKKFRYIMSHVIGKIEIVGIIGNTIYFRQHQAKDPAEIGRFFRRRLKKDTAWLDDLDD